LPTSSAALLFLAQSAVILAVTAACGWLVRLVRQPRVVGEILGGLLLGPLVLPHFAPRFASRLFPPGSMHPIEILSNLGLVVFLFGIGSELDLRAFLRNKASTVAVTLGSIAVPFALGAGLSPLLARRFPDENTGGLGFVLFMGVVVSITAFPVLARILQERRHGAAPLAPDLAATALMAAAANDLLGWSLMAIALTVLPQHGHAHPLQHTLFNLALLLLYVAFMLGVLQPLFSRLRSRFPHASSTAWILGLLVLAAISSQITDRLGVHAFFGAFLAGVCVPADHDGSRSLEHRLRTLLGPFTRLTLPLFFAMTGLRMQPEMFSSTELLWLGIILLIAVSGKLGGTALAGRAAGLPWSSALRIGVLMNTRGLVELIVLNVGYRENALSEELFTLLVLMALITTAMTVPLLDLSTALASRKPEAVAA
jgi:Kef-type K+ transport system membrane component KefB